MRKLMILVTVLAMAALIGACEEEDSGTNTGTGNKMTASVDGESWTAGNALFYNITKQISGGKSDGTFLKEISINLIDVTEGSATVRCQYSITENLGKPNQSIESWVNNSGNVEITEVTDSRIKGTFSFTASSNSGGDDITVTNGSFDVERVSTQTSL